MIRPSLHLAGKNFSDLVDIRKVGRLLEHFYNLTGIPSGILDADGSIQVAFGWQEICLRFHRKHAETELCCQESDRFIRERLMEDGYVEYKCKNGLWDMAAPIQIDGLHVGTVFLGQFFYDDEKIDRESFKERARRFGFPEDEYLEALDKVPRFSRKRVEQIMGMYTNLAGLLADMAGEAARQAESAEESRLRAAFLKNFVEAIPSPVFYKDADGFDLGCDRAFEEFLGKGKKDIVGRTINDVAPGDLEEMVRERTAELENANKMLREEISLREKFEDTLEVYRQAVENSDDLFAVLDRNYTYLMVNRAFLERRNTRRGRIIGKTAEEVLGEKTFRAIRGRIDDCLEGEAVEYEMKYEESGDEVRHMLVRYFPIRDNRGDVYRIVGMIRDITAAKLSEEKLRLSEARVRALMDAITESAFMIDLEGNILAANETMALRLNRSPEEIVGLNAYGLVPSDVARLRRKKVQRAVEEKQRVRFLDKRGDRDIDNVVYPIIDCDGGVDGIAVFARDVTEEKRAMESLQASEERFRKAVVNAPFPIMLHADDGEVLMISRAWTGLTGYVREDIRTIREWTERAYGVNRVEVEEAIGKLYETTEVVDNGEFSIRTKDGNRLVWDFSSAFLGKMPDGRKVVISMAVDVTARKKVEKELERRTRELERSNEELKHFAYVVSHDLQEPLRMVGSFLQLLESRYKEQLDDRAKKYIAFAVDGAHRMRDLIEDLLTYSRVQTKGLPFKDTDMERILQAVETDLAVVIEENDARIAHAPLPVVVADRTQMRQLVQNLVSNAIKYRSEEPPRIHVSCEKREPDWLFSVRDNGIGIAKKYHGLVFKLFKRLHRRDEYSGTGIGLAVAQRIVARHGGRIWVDSEEGKGSDFHFTLPFSPKF